MRTTQFSRNLNCRAREGAMKRDSINFGCRIITESKRLVAVLRCAGSCKARPIRYAYDGASNCAMMNAVGIGSRGCSWGCLGCGDCRSACRFGALEDRFRHGLPRLWTQACAQAADYASTNARAHTRTSSGRTSRTPCVGSLLQPRPRSRGYDNVKRPPA